MDDLTQRFLGLKAKEGAGQLRQQARDLRQLADRLDRAAKEVEAPCADVAKLLLAAEWTILQGTHLLHPSDLSRTAVEWAYLRGIGREGEVTQ